MNPRTRAAASLTALGIAAACGSANEPETPGPPAGIQVVSTATAVPFASPLPDSLAVRVVDAEARGVPGVQVDWTATPGIVTPARSETRRDGSARTAFRSSRAVGIASVTASLQGTLAVTIPVSVVAPRAVRFDGASGYVQVPAASQLNVGTGDFTWEIWFKRDRLGTREDVLTKKDVFADSEHDVAIVLEETGEVTAFLREFPGRQTILRTGSITGTGWVHVAMVRSGGSLQLYLNGALERSGNATFNVTSSGPLRIGANRSNMAGPDAPPVFPFAGLVHEVRIWNVARTAAQIADAATGCVERGAPGLVADYRFDEGAGPTLRDASPAANHGELRGGTLRTEGPVRCPGR